MNPEIKSLLKNEINEVKKAQISLVLGLILTISILTLPLFGISFWVSGVFLLPMILILLHQHAVYKIKKAMLILTRFIIDDEFAKTFNQDKNEK